MKQITNVDEYQELAMNTAKSGMTEKDVDKYCCMKLAEEVGELSGRVAKYYFHGAGWDQENMKEELGDILWYVARLATNNELDMSEILAFNIEKLEKRHGTKYDEEHYEKRYPKTNTE